jgi:hypothetical protein
MKVGKKTVYPTLNLLPTENGRAEILALGNSKLQNTN